MVQFILVRHGFSLGNQEKKFSGQLNVPLSEVGFAQAKQVADYIIKNFQVDRVYASDLSRAYDTVKPLADTLGVPIIKREDLREVCVGSWQGMLIEDVKNNFAKDFESYKTHPGLFRFPDGESYSDVRVRVSRAISEIAAENEGKTVVIGSHGGTIRILRALWKDISLEEIHTLPHVPNASVTVFTYDHEKATFTTEGYCDYLQDKVTEEGVK